MMSRPKRLHPISIFVGLGGKLKKTFFPLIAFIFFNHSGEDKVLFSIITTMVVIFFTFLSSLISWFRHTYQLDNSVLRIESGVFIRKKRYISFDRMQSIDISEGILQRMFGLVRLQIETAGGNLHDGAEAVLSAISKKDAVFLQASFTAYKKTGQLEITPFSTPLYQMTTYQLFLLSFTSGGFGVAVSVIIAFLSQLDDFVSIKKIFGRISLASGGPFQTIVFFLVVFFFIWVVAMIRTLLKYANFSVLKSGNELVISQGLLEKRQITIPINRIQAVHLKESIVHQWTGNASVFLESAGGTSIHSEGSSILLMPMVKVKQLNLMIELFLNDYHLSSDFKPVPKRSLLRYMIRSWYFVVPMIILSFIFLKTFGFLSLLIWIVVTFWAFLKYKDAGWNLHNQQLNIRYRALIRHSFFMKKNKIQALKVHESYFQSRKGLATLNIFIKSGKRVDLAYVTDIDREDAEEIFSWYMKMKRLTPLSEVNQN